jgi:hypothetical protein
MVLSVKIAREKEKGWRERAIGEREKICPSPQPSVIFFAVAI